MIRTQIQLPDELYRRVKRLAAEREMSPERKAASVAAIPLARAGHPSDIAGIVLSLASNLAAFTTGQVIVVDGGLGLTNARPHRGQIH